jgi:hypothetical protein
MAKWEIIINEKGQRCSSRQQEDAGQKVRVVGEELGRAEAKITVCPRETRAAEKTEASKGVPRELFELLHFSLSQLARRGSSPPGGSPAGERSSRGSNVVREVAGEAGYVLRGLHMLQGRGNVGSVHIRLGRRVVSQGRGIREMPSCEEVKASGSRGVHYIPCGSRDPGRVRLSAWQPAFNVEATDPSFSIHA